MAQRASINRRTRTHEIIYRNALAQSTGELDVDKVVERGRRALGIIDNYEIFAMGSKINGWKESVEAYEVVKPTGKTYEVQMRRDGQGSCNCPDWCTRRRVHAGLCKHVIAVKAIRQGRG